MTNNNNTLPAPDQLFKDLAKNDTSLKETQVLRRYLDLAKFTDLLRNQKLYLRRVDLFEDKFEGSLTPNLEAAFREAYNKPESTMTYEEFMRRIKQSTYINCWTASIHDNMALWKIYGQSNNAVVITTTVQKLEAELNKKTDGFHYIRKIEYINHWRNHRISIIPIANIFRYKLKAYSYEKEVRIIKQKPENYSSMSEVDTGMYIDVNLNDLLSSIIVSPDSEPWFIELVNDLTKRYGVTTPVRRSSMARNPF